MNIIDFLLPLIVVIPLLMSLILMFIPNITLSWILAIITNLVVFIIIILIVLVPSLLPVSYYLGGFMQPYGIEYKIDFLNLFFMFTISLVALVCVLWSKKSVITEIGDLKARYFYPVYLLSIAGFLGVLITNDLFNLYVFLEISSLTSYVLIALNNKKESSLSAFNYLIVGTIGASFYVFGVGIFYALFGTLNATDLASKIVEAPISPLFILGSTLIIVGLLSKIAIFPIFWWLPKVYQNSTSTISAFLSGISTKVAIYLLIKILITILSKNPDFAIDSILNIIIILAILSMFVGGMLAVQQNSLKLLLAFSSVSQIGFIMLGFAIFNVEGISAALFSVLTHSLIKVGLFLCVGNILLVYGSDNINRISGLGSKLPFTFFAMIFFSLSLAAVPGTSVFWGKLYLIIAAFKSPYWILGFIVIIASLLSFFYSWKIISSLWLTRSKINNTKDTELAINNSDNDIKSVFLKHNNKVTIYMNVAIGFLIFLNIIITLYPTFVLYYAEQIISFLIATRR